MGKKEREKSEETTFEKRSQKAVTKEFNENLKPFRGSEGGRLSRRERVRIKGGKMVCTKAC